MCYKVAWYHLWWIMMGGMMLRVFKPNGPGASRDALGPRSYRSCLGTWGVRGVLGRELKSHQRPSGCCRECLGSQHWFPDVAQRMRACDVAMYSIGATVIFIHSVEEVLGKGSGVPTCVACVSAMVVPSFSRHFPLFRALLRLVPSRPLSCVWGRLWLRSPV